MIKYNLIANYIGHVWVALMGLLFIPIYIKYLGIEAYGLIGLFAVLQAWLSLLDMGMAPTLNREFSRFNGGANGAIRIRDLLRSVEWIMLAIALLTGAAISISSSWLAAHWINSSNLSYEVVTKALSLMGIVTSLRFIESIYKSALLGLQRQVIYNALNCMLATFRGFGAVGILAWISPTIEAFFIWQGVISLLSLGCMAAFVYCCLPKTVRRGKFSFQALNDVGAFASGMMGITFLSLLLTQVDKLLLSKLLSLEDYGYYMLAAVAAGSLYSLNNPIIQAFFPSLNSLHAENKNEKLINRYHQGCQLVSVFMGSAAVIIIVFSKTILELWTNDIELAKQSYILLSLLALGNLLHGVMAIPYQAQLVYGWTRLSIYLNIISVIVVVPALLLITPHYGAEGAAWVWICLNVGNVFFGIHFMFRKIMATEKWSWYIDDVFKPIFSAILIASFIHLIIPKIFQETYKALFLISTSILVFLASSLSATHVRGQFKKYALGLMRR